MREKAALEEDEGEKLKAVGWLAGCLVNGCPRKLRSENNLAGKQTIDAAFFLPSNEQLRTIGGGCALLRAAGDPLSRHAVRRTRSHFCANPLKKSIRPRLKLVAGKKSSSDLKVRKPRSARGEENEAGIEGGGRAHGEANRWAALRPHRVQPGDTSFFSLVSL